MTDGLLIVDKPSGPTSHDLVDLIRRGTGEKRVGHTGTLDPMATGVLVLCLGIATRLSEYLLGEDKRYEARVRFGASTTTYDADGEVTTRGAVKKGRADVEAALAGFRGKIKQAPPPYSAVKRAGRKAYELARRGEAVALEPRDVTVYDLRLDDWQPPDAALSVHCSAGTYIRSLAHDLGQALGCGAHLAALRRVAAGPFDLSHAVTVDKLRVSMSDGSWVRYLVAPETALRDWRAVRLDAPGVDRIAHGQPVPLVATDGRLALAYGPDGRLIAIVEPDEAAGLWRPRKVFIR
jgi:tRNA pseudouridine55 synthase